MKTVIILGSARHDGNTRQVVTELARISTWDIIDLLDYDISHYDYSHSNKGDDFIGLMKDLTQKYEVLVLATPVYWYAMSGIMKVFFDRITDLLKIEKDTGRLLRGKYMAVISNSNGGNMGDQFWLPFKMSAEYLGMHYLGDLHTYQGKLDKEAIKSFKEMIDAIK